MMNPNKKKWADVVEIISGKNQKKVANPNGKYPIYGSGGIIGYADDFLCEAGTTIVGRKGTINNPIFVNERFWNVDTAYGIFPQKELLPQYLYYFCQAFNFKVLDKSTTIPSLSKRDLLNIEMPVPPLIEQKRIVLQIEELFSNLDAGVEILQKVRHQVDVYRQAVLKSAFNEVSNGEKRTIKTVCEKVVDCPHSTPKWVENGKLCLRTTNFKRGYLDLSEKNYVSNETFDARNKRLVPKSGDILFSREGAILGIACIIPEKMEVCLGQRMMLLRTNKSINNKFLMYYLNSPMVNKLVMQNIGGTASPHINVGDIKEFLIPTPDISNQLAIVEEIEARLSVCDNIEKTVESVLKQAGVMRQCILKNAFEGRIQA